jgi:hypothetical protein
MYLQIRLLQNEHIMALRGDRIYLLYLPTAAALLLADYTVHPVN